MILYSSACSVGSTRKTYRILERILMEREPLEDIDVDDGIILKLKKADLRMWTGFMQLR
jgi:hypothetical protein